MYFGGIYWVLAQLLMERIQTVEGHFIIKEGNLISYVGNAAKAVVPDGVERICEWAFYGNDSLTEVVLPKGVKSIGEKAFCSCSRLERVTFPEGLKRIGAKAFRDCVALTEIALPLGLVRIGKRAFCGCTSLTRVVISEGTKRIDNEAFNGCGALTEVTLPDSIEAIGKCAFNGVSAVGVIHTSPCTMQFLESEGSEGAWAAAIRGFLTRYFANENDGCERAELSSELKAEWKRYISRRTVKVFRLLALEPLLFRWYLAEYGNASPERLEELALKTDNIECRAMLMDRAHKLKKKEKSVEEIVDGRLSLEI